MSSAQQLAQPARGVAVVRPFVDHSREGDELGFGQADGPRRARSADARCRASRRIVGSACGTFGQLERECERDVDLVVIDAEPDEVEPPRQLFLRGTLLVRSEELEVEPVGLGVEASCLPLGYLL